MAMVSFEECPQGVVSVSGTLLFRGGLNMLLNGSVKRFGVGVGCVEVEWAECIETDYLRCLN